MFTGGQRDPSPRPQVAVATRRQGQEGGLHPPLMEASEVGWVRGSGVGANTSLCMDHAPHSREGSLSSELGSIPLRVAFEAALRRGTTPTGIQLLVRVSTLRGQDLCPQLAAEFWGGERPPPASRGPDSAPSPRPPEKQPSLLCPAPIQDQGHCPAPRRGQHRARMGAQPGKGSSYL